MRSEGSIFETKHKVLERLSKPIRDKIGDPWGSIGTRASEATSETGGSRIGLKFRPWKILFYYTFLYIYHFLLAYAK